MSDLASRITKPDAAPAAADSEAKPAQTAPAADNPADGAGPGLVESNYDVEVKLSDLQNDAQNPLYSVSAFEDLGL